MRRRHRVMLAVCIAAASLATVPCDAKVINADASSSHWLKIRAGLSQSVHWLWDFVAGRRASRRPRKVKLALVGLGRTGSTSFSAALKELGYAPIHDDEATEVSDVYEGMMDGSLTMDEVNAKLGERGFDAPMVSLPGYVEWAAAAPGVKVVLTTRDASKWARSWLSVVPTAHLPYQRPFRWLKPMRELAAFNWEVMVNVPTNYKPELYDDVPALEAGFEAWTRYVVETVPAERLLVFDVREGWGPLCEFLDAPIPEGKFPHINDRVVVDVIVKVFVAITWTWPLLVVLPFLAAYFLVRVCRRRESSARRGMKRE